MRKTLLLVLSLLWSMIILGQSNINIINEDFSNETLPSGWEAMGNGKNNWLLSYSFSAGGKPNELQLQWSPMFNGIARYVSPAVDLTGISSTMLSLDHYAAMFGNTGGTIGVATSSDGGNTWNSVWSEKYTKTDKYSVVTNITSPDMGKSNVNFCIYFEGNSSVIQSWYFDNFRVYVVEDIDMEITSIDVPSCVSHGEHPIEFTVKNTGESAIKSFEARCIINGEEEFSETFYSEINYNESKQFAFETNYNFLLGQSQGYELDIEIFRINDDEIDKSDKALPKRISVALGEIQRTLMIEHFSSSTCAPCPNANYGMEVLTSNNPGKYTYTKYAMNWPGSGDPYYTEEGGNKRFYYNIGGAPELYLDGVVYGNTYIDIETFNKQYEKPALANVRGAFNVDGNTINVTADFMSYFDAKNVTAYIAVNEKTTTGNVGTNGETKFHHMMLKMLNDDKGTTFDINAGEYKRLEFSYDMSKTFMEEIDDLEVALWLQDDATKEIFNSHFAYEYTDHCYPIRNLTSLVNDNKVTIKWDAPEKGNPAGYNVFIDGELVAEKTKDLEYSTDLGNKQVVEIVAVYNNDMTSVGLAKQISAINGINDTFAHNIRIYPNPVNDKLFIETEVEIMEVSVYDVYGRKLSAVSCQLSAINGQQSLSIDVNELNSGVYFVKVVTSEGEIVKRFFKK